MGTARQKLNVPERSCPPLWLLPMHQPPRFLSFSLEVGLDVHSIWPMSSQEGTGFTKFHLCGLDNYQHQPPFWPLFLPQKSHVKLTQFYFCGVKSQNLKCVWNGFIISQTWNLQSFYPWARFKKQTNTKTWLDSMPQDIKYTFWDESVFL